jgi:hypothetical protein
MVNTQTCKYIMLNWSQSFFVDKIGKKKELIFFFTAWKFIMRRREKNVIRDATIWTKKKEKRKKSEFE